MQKTPENDSAAYGERNGRDWQAFRWSHGFTWQSLRRQMIKKPYIVVYGHLTCLGPVLLRDNLWNTSLIFVFPGELWPIRTKGTASLGSTRVDEKHHTRGSIYAGHVMSAQEKVLYGIGPKNMSWHPQL